MHEGISKCGINGSKNIKRGPNETLYFQKCRLLKRNGSHCFWVMNNTNALFSDDHSAAQLSCCVELLKIARECCNDALLIHPWFPDEVSWCVSFDLPKNCRWTLIWCVLPVTGLPIKIHIHTHVYVTQTISPLFAKMVKRISQHSQILLD